MKRIAFTVVFDVEGEDVDGEMQRTLFDFLDAVVDGACEGRPGIRRAEVLQGDECENEEG
jgi:hypothetical protein